MHAKSKSFVVPGDCPVIINYSLINALWVCLGRCREKERERESPRETGWLWFRSWATFELDCWSWSAQAEGFFFFFSLLVLEKDGEKKRELWESSVLDLTPAASKRLRPFHPSSPSLYFFFLYLSFCLLAVILQTHCLLELPGIFRKERKKRIMGAERKEPSQH